MKQVDTLVFNNGNTLTFAKREDGFELNGVLIPGDEFKSFLSHIGGFANGTTPKRCNKHANVPASTKLKWNPKGKWPKRKGCKAWDVAKYVGPWSQRPIKRSTLVKKLVAKGFTEKVAGYMLSTLIHNHKLLVVVK